MLKPIDAEDVLNEIEHKVATTKTKLETKPVSSKLGLLIGIVLLSFIGATFVFNQVVTATPNVSPIPTTKKKVQVASKSAVLDQAKAIVMHIGESVMEVGKKTGAAVLGASVKFIQKEATASASKVASAAASTATSVILKSTAPAIVEQIHKLPQDQQKEVRQLLCK